LADVHNRETRSRNMAAIKSGDTKPEMMIRRGLHARGLRFRLHDSQLPGKPDLVLPRHQVVIFVNGCFWHGHDCSMFHWPKTRAEFWQAKISGTVIRDQRNQEALLALGWRIGTIWECAVKGPNRQEIENLLDPMVAAILDPRIEHFSFQGGGVDLDKVILRSV
jgi:DNA mismatch endonuclease (patch repair protein)